MSKAKTDERLKSIPMFSDLSNKELRSVSRLMTAVTVAEGTDIITQDEIGREFMILLTGTAVVRRNGRKLADIGPGDMTGEVGVLSDSPRMATVTATSPMVIEVLNRRELMTLLDEQPRMAKKILLAAIRRLHDLEISKTA
ncbi:MAG: cyclic nucleotide-binding domain-containing protein [Acidimicrobiales bacterium]